mmetsp:Transcript_23915/g.71890  ORF Transcript_23915/g.71890 Transcript_23915/m.71890 type:complete len:270 (-) Transcript_23915:480-1289(-)
MPPGVPPSESRLLNARHRGRCGLRVPYDRMGVGGMAIIVAPSLWPSKRSRSSALSAAAAARSPRSRHARTRSSCASLGAGSVAGRRASSKTKFAWCRTSASRSGGATCDEAQKAAGRRRTATGSSPANAIRSRIFWSSAPVASTSALHRRANAASRGDGRATRKPTLTPASAHSRCASRSAAPCAASSASIRARSAETGPSACTSASLQTNGARSVSQSRANSPSLNAWTRGPPAARRGAAPRSSTRRHRASNDGSSANCLVRRSASTQ